MRISAKVDYAVRALTELAAAGEGGGGGGPVKGDRIAANQGMPVNFVENILGELRRAGLVLSQRGADGGYRLAVAPETITVADVIRVVEGPLADVRGEPPEDLAYPGPARALRDVWVATRANLRAVLEAVTIADIAAGTIPAAVVDLTDQPGAWARRC